MKIQFLGATQTVTGSKFFLDAEESRLMIDCGLFQGLKDLRLKNWQELPVDIKNLDAVILTHAHLDHSGYIPVLYKNGYRGPIYTTPATKELCGILLPDSGYLQEEEAMYANRKGFSKHKPALPLYTENEARRSLELFETVPQGKEFGVNQDIKVKFTPAGHILGASCVHVVEKKTEVVFSGDIGPLHDIIMKPPETIENADYLILESTYGNRLHSDTDPMKQIEDIINRTIARGGVLLIPSFAVGRAQMVLHIISDLMNEKRIENVPVYLNSPMAINATEIFCRYVNEHRLSERQCDEMCATAKYVRTAEESKALNKKDGPMIIVSASGMATGGRILHHLKAYVSDPANTVLFVGYQAAGTRGEAMISGIDRIKIHGKYYPVRAEVDSIHSLSAHADYRDIVDWVSGIKNPPKKIFLVHGEPSAQDNLRRLLEEEVNSEVVIPAYLEKAELK